MDQPTASILTAFVAAASGLFGVFGGAALTRRNSEKVWRTQQAVTMRLDLYRGLLVAIDANRRYWQVTAMNVGKLKDGRMTREAFDASQDKRSDGLKEVMDDLFRARAMAALISEDTAADFEKTMMDVRVDGREFTDEMAAEFEKSFSEAYDRIGARGRQELREAELRD